MHSAQITWLLYRAPRMGFRPQLSHSTLWCTCGAGLAVLLRALLCALLSASVFCAFPLGTPAIALRRHQLGCLKLRHSTA